MRRRQTTLEGVQLRAEMRCKPGRASGRLKGLEGARSRAGDAWRLGFASRRAMISLVRMARAWMATAVLLAGGWTGACRAVFDPSQLPPELRADYDLFAQRCSKCHSLARPLGSGIDDDRFWREYVEQMRLKPGSGISVADEEPILRFLHFYSAQQHPRDATPEVPTTSVAVPSAPASTESK